MSEPTNALAKREEDFRARLMMHDGLENFMTGLGTGKDKNSYNEWIRSGRNRDHEQLIVRYREDWVAQKVCNILPEDMTREWRRCSTPEAIELMMNSISANSSVRRTLGLECSVLLLLSLTLRVLAVQRHRST
ncbi:hypothetical protein AH6C_082 [Aeromonas phage pAh6-C]|uniref:Uncharacterized protein n=1 Tax=Aeromonas phage pAh6-C TaxID=1505227 RepID=A0A076G3S3_9CAUD|nr:hypothetical protein AH6C_082 [Aeromonas phage pAh6-C]AII26836.1 hypothetical protein AH6C_082 [Aeromonas phage pAh6-C]